MKARRRRGLLLLALALVSGGLAMSQVRERERQVEARVGPLVPVLVTSRDLPADARVADAALGVRQVPARYVPPGALAPGARVAGARTAVAVAAGTYLTAAHLQGGDGGVRRGGALAAGERAVEIGVSGGGNLERLAPGARVDVVVSTETGAGGGRTFVALANVELLGLRQDASGAAYAGEDSDGSAAPTMLATLRVTLRQAVYLTAADNYGREIRLFARPPGDRSRDGGSVSASEL